MNYFRLQLGHYTLEEMQSFTSADGGDDMEEAGGICACASISDLMRNTIWDASDMEDAEVVVFRGSRIEKIYDGERVYPEEILYRIKASEVSDDNEEVMDKLLSLETW